jgi:hypothetical protein
LYNQGTKHAAHSPQVQLLTVESLAAEQTHRSELEAELLAARINSENQARVDRANAEQSAEQLRQAASENQKLAAALAQVQAQLDEAAGGLMLSTIAAIVACMVHLPCGMHGNII